MDVDFSKGLIENSIFENVGNDAIDISGSNVTALNININGSGDKAISAGEASKLIANNISIKNSNIGIASKDLSLVKAKNLNFETTKYCYAAYQKKPEYGPGSIRIERGDTLKIKINSSTNCSSYLLEKNSNIIHVDKKFRHNYANLRDLLYP